LIIKFYSLAQLRTEADETARRYEDRLSFVQARSKRYLDRTSQAQRFAGVFNKQKAGLKDLLQRSLERLSRERLRLANQRSSVHPVYTRRQHDLDERKADWESYLVCLELYREESNRFEAEALASQHDSAACEKLLADCVKALESANKGQSPHYVWMFEALSSLKLGKSLPAIIPAIKVPILSCR
jgi:predicted ATP-binding protein involved in virulence